MRISQLAERAGVPVATVKYYLREELLPPGRLTGATQAQYSEEHLTRLRLVRTMLAVGGLSVAQVRATLAVLDGPDVPVRQALGAAHCAMASRSPNASVDLSEALAHLQRWGWQVSSDSPSLVLLAEALRALRTAELREVDEVLDRYARVAEELGARDVLDLTADPPSEAVRDVVVRTLLLEPVLLALRRLAQEAASHTGQPHLTRPGPVDAATVSRPFS